MYKSVLRTSKSSGRDDSSYKLLSLPVSRFISVSVLQYRTLSIFPCPPSDILPKLTYAPYRHPATG
ncbi:hypothetical protein BC826DRAFT_1057278 [Russula brevipes]|nr:hypothetical protein BC826DRAFT_1057278 [Russula brevipes]